MPILYIYWHSQNEEQDRLQTALKKAWDFTGENQNWEPFAHNFDGVSMMLVPVGCFDMGTSEEQLAYAQDVAVNPDWDADELPAHTVCFTKPFWIDQMEVTNSQFGRAGEFSGDHHPREKVSWAEAEVFCESRNARLPTEAEWEYAARGPSAGLYPWGNVFDESRIVFTANADGQTADAGSKPGGASWVGALDLIGNVWEWVSDWYSADYYALVADQAADPAGPTTGQTRVLRGGSWVDDFPFALRAADRFWSEPGTQYNNIGFRCVRPLD